MDLLGKQANARLSAMTALLAVAGISVIEGAALPTPEAAAASLAERNQSAVDSAVATATAGVETLKTSLALANAQSAAVLSGLAAAGVKLGDLPAADFQPAADAKAGDLVPAAVAVKSAVETAIAAKSAKQIAGAGHPAIALETPAASASAGAVADASEVPASAEDFLKTHRAIKEPAAQTAYFRKHAHRFPTR